MIAGVATSNAFPLHPFAAEQNVKVLQESAKNYSLGQLDSKMLWPKRRRAYSQWIHMQN